MGSQTLTLLSLLLVIFSAFLLLGFVSTKCNQQDYGHGSFVCVCSERLSCEDGELKDFKINSDKSVITGVRSSKSGKRFVRKEYRFSKDEPKEDAGQKLVRLSVDSGKRYNQNGVILGFGGAFTDAAGFNIRKLPSALQDQLLKDYFSPDEGLGYTLCRVPIGGSDFSPRLYSLDDYEGDDKLEHFALQPEDFDYKLPYIHRAQAIAKGQLRIFGSAWSSPKWMKTNHEFNHGGFLIGEPGGKYYKLYAAYLVKFLQAYAGQNVSVWGMTVVNEPEFGFDPHWGINVLGFNGSMQRDFVRQDLGPALQQAGFGPEKLKLMIHDDNTNKMKEFVHTVLEDPEARKFVSGVAFHWYANGGSGQIGPLDFLAPLYPDVFYLNTEACDLSDASLGNWTRATRYAEDIINDLNHHSSGWVEWNMVLDVDSKAPGWARAHMDANIIVNSSAAEYYKQPTYYAEGHFSRFLPVGSVRIGHELIKNSVGESGIMVTAFERPDGVKVATVLNKNEHEVKLVLHDPKSETGGGFVEVQLEASSIESLLWY